MGILIQIGEFGLHICICVCVGVLEEDDEEMEVEDWEEKEWHFCDSKDR